MNLAVDQRLLAWTLITFGGVVAILARFAFKPLQQLLAERERRIRESLDEARKAREEAEAIRREGEGRMNEAREEARRILEEGRRLAADTREEAGRTARAEADAVLRKAREEIERESRRSVDALRGAVASISLQVARDVIRESLDEKRHRELVDEYVRRLKEGHGSEPR